jgi:hypothetical protein
MSPYGLYTSLGLNFELAKSLSSVVYPTSPDLAKALNFLWVFILPEYNWRWIALWYYAFFVGLQPHLVDVQSSRGTIFSLENLSAIFCIMGRLKFANSDKASSYGAFSVANVRI